MRAKNPLSDPDELAALQDQFRALSMDNKKIAKANKELGQMVQLRDMKIQELMDTKAALEKELKKKEGLKNQKKQLKEKQKEIKSLKHELVVQQLGVKKEGREDELRRENERLKVELNQNDLDLADMKNQRHKQERVVKDLTRMLEEKAS